MPRSRLRDDDRAALIARYQAGETKPALAAAFSVPLSTVRYHTAGVVRPAVAAAQLRAFTIKLARVTPVSSPVLVPAAAPPADPEPPAPARYTQLSPAQRALLRKRWRDGTPPAALAAVFGLAEDTIAALMTGVAHSPLGAQREQARRAAQARAQQGYSKLHPGASAVRITPARGGGVELRISRELYRQLGTPERLDVRRHGSRLLVSPGTRYGVVNRGRSGMPRIAMGATMHTALRLPQAGHFSARFYAQRQPHLSIQVPVETRSRTA